MSLYNMVNGYRPEVYYILPMLGKHPDEYPRFRNCFSGKMTNSTTEVDSFDIPMQIADEQKVISIYTRVGGNNRSDYIKEIAELRAMPEYLEDYDDTFDNTFATFVFKVPEKWLADYEHFMNDDPENYTVNNFSDEYKQEIVRVYPKIKDKLVKVLNA